MFAHFTASLLEEQFEAVVLRLQHVFVKDFFYEISDKSFMRYWMERKTDFAVNEIDFKRGT